MAVGGIDGWVLLDTGVTDWGNVNWRGNIFPIVRRILDYHLMPYILTFEILVNKMIFRKRKRMMMTMLK